MSTNNLSIDEQEIHIVAGRTEPYATAYVSDITYITYMDKRVKANPDEFTVVSADSWGKTYRFPKKYISIRSKNGEQTEKQRQASRERLLKLNSNKNNMSK